MTLIGTTYIFSTKKEDELEKENAELRAALKFYADYDNWLTWDGDEGDYVPYQQPIDADQGNTARAALKEKSE